MTLAHDHIPNFKKLINNGDVLTQSTKNRSAEIFFNIRKIVSDGEKYTTQVRVSMIKNRRFFRTVCILKN